MPDKILLDQQVEDRFFRCLFEYQDNIFAIIHDRIEAKHFSTIIKSRVWNVLRHHYQEHEEVLAVDALYIELKRKYKLRDDAIKPFRMFIQRVMKLPCPQWGWIVSRIDQWVREVKLQKALYTAREAIDNSDVSSAEEMLLRTLREGGINTTASTSIFDMSVEDISDVTDDKHLFCCPTRIYALDKVIKGLYRKELFVIMSSLNVGKSFACVHLAISALIEGKGVMWITLEMTTQKVMTRFFQSIAGVPKPRESELSRVVNVWNDEWSERSDKMKRHTTLNGKNIHTKLGFLKQYGGRLRIAEYNSDEATISDIEREVLMFDAVHEKMPDLVIVDGLHDLHHDQRFGRSSYAKAAKDLRSLASNFDLSVVATHQANREGMRADVLDAYHTSESLGIMQTADTAISLNQSDAEQKLGTLRVFVMRARGTEKWNMIKVYQLLDIGQFCIGSSVMTKEQIEAMKNGELDNE